MTNTMSQNETENQRNEVVEEWVSCPECGSEDVKVTNPEYYTSLFECLECGADLGMGW